MRRKLIVWGLVIIWAIFIFILSSIPVLKIEQLGYWDFILRKIAHFLEFVVLVLLFSWALFLSLKEKFWKIFLLVLVAGFLYAALDEFHQLYVAGRQGNLADVGIDSLGVLFGALIYYYFKFIYKKKQP